MTFILTCILGLNIHCSPQRAIAQAPITNLESRIPLSQHYVAPVLTLARDAMEDARDGLRFTGTQFVFFDYLWRVAEPFAQAMTASRSVTTIERTFLTDTVCLRHDRGLLLDQIAAVRGELRRALSERRLGDVLQLVWLTRYLQERVSELEIGAFHPTYRDGGFSDGSICPFDLRYWPETAEGYGCTAAVLAEIADADVGARAEMEAQLLLNAALDRFRGGRFTPQAAVRRQTPVQPRNCTEPEELPRGGIAVSARGRFSVEEDLGGWLRTLLDFLQEAGRRRRQPGVAADAFEYDFRVHMQEWIEQQVLADAGIVVQSVHATGEIDPALEPLRRGMREFALLSGDTGERGVRQFNNRFISHLLRSCTFRPCRSRLLRLWRLNAADACFPYADGSSLRDPEGYMKCSREAGLEE